MKSRPGTKLFRQPPSRLGQKWDHPSPLKIYANDAERQKARRLRNYERGLNSVGKPYQRHPHFINRSGSPQQQNEQRRRQRENKLKNNMVRYRRFAQKNLANGLRADGRPFRRHKQYHAWKQLRSTIRVPLVSFEDVTVEGLGGTYK